METENSVFDQHFNWFRKGVDNSENKSVVMEYFKKEKTNKRGNPYYDRIGKRIIVEFEYGKKYSEEVKAENPEYEFKGGKVQYTKYDENDFLESNTSGELSFGVVDPNNIKSEYYVLDENEQWVKWDKETFGDVYDYLPKRKDNKPIDTPSYGVVYRRYKYENVISLSVGGTKYINPDFKEKLND
jgi:hypothetical protein